MFRTTVVVLSMAVPTSTLAQGPYLADQSTTALYHFDEGTGTVASDSSENSLDASIVQATWADGRFGHSLEFDGEYPVRDDNVSIQSHDLTATPFETLEAWIMLLEEPQQWTTVIDHTTFLGQQGRALYVVPGRFVEARSLFDAGMTSIAVSPSPIPLAEWVHIAAVFDETEGSLRLFVDGIEVAYTALKCCQFAGESTTTIGRSNSFQADYFHGRIDEVRISSSAREFQPVSVENGTLSLIKQLYR